MVTMIAPRCDWQPKVPTAYSAETAGGAHRTACKSYNSAVSKKMRSVTVRRFASHEEADRHDAEYWQRLSPSARVDYVWRLSVEQWELLGRKADEPGLCRSVARLRRR